MLLQKACAQLCFSANRSMCKWFLVLLCVCAYDFDDYDYDFYAVKELNELWLPFDWLLFIDSKNKEESTVGRLL